MWGRGEAIKNVKLEILKVVLAMSINDMMFSLHFCSSIILALMLHYFFPLMTFYFCFLFTHRAEKEPPSTLLWALFLLAQVVCCYLDVWFLSLPISLVIFLIDLLFIQHYDRRGQYDIALSKIDEAIEHTPTVIDLYSIKVC